MATLSFSWDIEEGATYRISYRPTESDEAEQITVTGVTSSPFTATVTGGLSYEVSLEKSCGDSYSIAATTVIIPGELVLTSGADNALSMTMTSSSITLLSAEEITSPVATLSEYVIDWHLDSPTGELVFSSSSADITGDPTISMVHPFVDQVVPGGTLYPKIKKIKINGLEHRPDFVSGIAHSPDLATILGSVDVAPILCNNGGDYTEVLYGGEYIYNHKIEYNYVTDSPLLASRTMRFLITGQLNYFAWQFAAYSVEDTIRISYVDRSAGTETVLEYWKVGTSITDYPNLTTSPKVVVQTDIRIVTDLTAIDQTPGDYLKIEVIASELTTTTNWAFLCKCLDEFVAPTIDYQLRTIVPDSIDFTYNPVTCYNSISYERPIIDPSALDSAYTKYTSQVFYSSISDVTSNVTTLQGSAATYAYAQAYESSSNCQPLEGHITMTVSSSSVVLVFSDPDDYAFYKGRIGVIYDYYISPDFVNDPTSVYYYCGWLFNLHIANNCEDIPTFFSLYLHYNNPPVSDDATSTITLTAGTITNGYVTVPPACDTSTVPGVATLVYKVNRWITSQLDPGTYTTYVKYTWASVTSFKMEVIEPDPVFSRSSYFIYFYDNLQDFQALNQFVAVANASYLWLFFVHYDQVEITNPSDAANNFRLYRAINVYEGAVIPDPADYLLIYEKSAGVVTVDNIEDYNNGLLRYDPPVCEESVLNPITALYSEINEGTIYWLITMVYELSSYENVVEVQMAEEGDSYFFPLTVNNGLINFNYYGNNTTYHPKIRVKCANNVYGTDETLNLVIPDAYTFSPATSCTLMNFATSAETYSLEVNGTVVSSGTVDGRKAVNFNCPTTGVADVKLTLSTISSADCIIANTASFDFGTTDPLDPLVTNWTNANLMNGFNISFQPV